MSETALDHARAQFAQAKLPFPPIPAEMGEQLRTLDAWVWSTREGIPNPYLFRKYVDEFSSGAVKTDYLVFGHAGHGVNSYAMHYYLVRGALALFDQMAWGGVYTDNDVATRAMAAHFAQIQVMIDTLDIAAQGKLLLTGERFVVVLSDLYGGYWLWKELSGRQNGDSLLALQEAVSTARKIVGDSE